MFAALALLLVACAGAWAWERSRRRTRAMPGGLHADITLRLVRRDVRRNAPR